MIKIFNGIRISKYKLAAFITITILSGLHPLIYTNIPNQEVGPILCISISSTIISGIAVLGVLAIFTRIKMHGKLARHTKWLPYIVLITLCLLSISLQGGVQNWIGILSTIRTDGAENFGRLIFAIYDPIIILSLGGMVLWTGVAVT